ncbi:MAG: hypothetical protein K8R41_08270 [Bacteroidales bacterium]|nr:hypothetical protein [Bacteroidales bacterium]
MKIIVDTNIVFSGILNQKSRIGKILISEQKYFDFYSCYYLQTELINHYPKIVNITKKSSEIIVEIEKYVTKNIKFINEIIIPKNFLIESEKLVKDVDFDDILFVALTKYLNGRLWTGDKQLIKHLKMKGFTQIITTQEILRLLDKY